VCLHLDPTLCSSKCWSSFCFETIDLTDLDNLYEPQQQQQQQQQPQQQQQQQQNEPELMVLGDADENEIRNILELIKNDPICQDFLMEQVEEEKEQQEQEEEVQVLGCFEKPVYSDISDDEEEEEDEDDQPGVKKFKKCFQNNNKLLLRSQLPTDVSVKKFLPKEIECIKSDCDYKSVSIDDFIGHVRDHTLNDIEMFQCAWKKCKFQSKSRTHMYHHMAGHSIEKSLCGLWQFGCKFWAADLPELANHYIQYHARTKKPYLCSYPGCSSAFICENYLIKHKYIHVGSAPFYCGYRNCKTRTDKLTRMLLHKNNEKHFETVEIDQQYQN